MMLKILQHKEGTIQCMIYNFHCSRLSTLETSTSDSRWLEIHGTEEKHEGSRVPLFRDLYGIFQDERQVSNYWIKNLLTCLA